MAKKRRSSQRMTIFILIGILLGISVFVKEVRAEGAKFDQSLQDFAANHLEKVALRIEGMT